MAATQQPDGNGWCAMPGNAQSPDTNASMLPAPQLKLNKKLVKTYLKHLQASPTSLGPAVVNLPTAVAAGRTATRLADCAARQSVGQATPAAVAYRHPVATV